MQNQATLTPSVPPAQLPVRQNLTLFYGLSLAMALILALASVAGLLYQDSLYPTEELRQSFLANDVVNLFVGLPILLGSLWLAWRGRLVGLLFWPGALFYVFYNALVYILALPLNVAFALNLVLLAMSAYTMIGFVAGIEARAVQHRLAGAVPERLAGGVLMGLGTLFLLRVVAALAGALINDAPITGTELALHVTDFVISPALVTGGLLLWRRRALGYVSGMGLLFHASMLFVGLIAILLLQPLLTTAPFNAVDLVVVAIMGLVCFVPFGLFVRGVLSQG